LTTLPADNVATGAAPGAGPETQPGNAPVRLIAGESLDEAVRDGIGLCLSGGGYRAMLFHVGAVLRLNDAGLLRKLSRVSSVSGGSITAGGLALRWRDLAFDSNGVAQRLDLVRDAILGLAARTVDEGSIFSGLLMPGVSIGDRVTEAYKKHLFRDATLQDLPADAEGPRFIFNSTSVQTGALWRFSRPYMGDYRVGLIRNPRLALARAVAASSAFPPLLSPIKLDVNPDDFDPATRGPLFKAPFNDEVVLSDGGVYDNLGLETTFKNYRTVLVSDAGQKPDDDGSPAGDWAQHSIRILNLIDNQVRSLRKRQLVQSYIDGQRSGAYWGIRTDIADYGLGAGAMDAPFSHTTELAAVPTRLKRIDEQTQERLINWGYAVCDAALRAHVDPALRKGTFPYSRGV